jgi:hypothetical protein
MKPSELNLTTEVIGHQRLLFIRLPEDGVDSELAGSIDHLGGGMENLHDVDGGPSGDDFSLGRFQLLRAETGMSSDQDIAHAAMMESHAMIRLEAATSEPLIQYETGLRELIESRSGSVESLVGVNRPRSYTSYAMTKFAYDPALPPGTGEKFPLGVVTPMNKTGEWWAMDWLHRESMFLPRYDEKENLVVKGHALAAEVGVAHINRRLMHAPDGYGDDQNYDFVGYFEFAEEHAPTFRAVMAGLRDVAQNPEWAYVSEGPEWWGRRVGRAADLWDSD